MTALMTDKFREVWKLEARASEPLEAISAAIGVILCCSGKAEATVVATMYNILVTETDLKHELTRGDTHVRL